MSAREVASDTKRAEIGEMYQPLSRLEPRQPHYSALLEVLMEVRQPPVIGGCQGAIPGLEDHDPRLLVHKRERVPVHAGRDIDGKLPPDVRHHFLGLVK